MAIVIDYLVRTPGVPLASVIKRCSLILQDEDHVRWTTSELLEWINESVTAIINARPSVAAYEAVLVLAQGARQKLSAAVTQLTDVSYSLESDGITVARAISRTDRSLLDLSVPKWQSMPPAAQVRHFMFDDQMPSVFYVYPPVLDGVKVRASISVIPEPVEADDDLIPIREDYADSVVNYVCYRCYSKDSEYANAGMATAFYSAFQASMAAEGTGALASTPNSADV